MIEITKGNSTQRFSLDKLAAICVQLAGGGYTMTQTAKAMDIKNKLNAGQMVKTNGYTVKIIA